MKLFIVLSVIACSYAAKLDRTYLPPPGAASAGGSPGSLTAPFSSSSEPGSVQPSFGTRFGSNSASEPQRTSPSSGQGQFGQRGSSGFARPSTPSRFGSPSGAQGPAGFSQTPAGTPQSGSSQGPSGFDQQVPSRFSSNRPTGSPAFGQTSTPSGASGQPGYGPSPSGPAQASSQGPQGASGFGQPLENRFSSRPSTSPAFGQSGTPSGFDAPGAGSDASSDYDEPSGPSGFGQPTQSGFGQTPSGFNQGQAGPFGGQSQQPERPQAADDRNAETLRYDSQNDGETFAYSFETSNGISAEESGVATNGVQAQGAFAYTGDDGERYSVSYTADERGYLPQGDHLPTPPPIPDEILRSIEENARAAAAGTQEGAYNPDEDNASGPQQYNAGVAPGFQGQAQGPNQQLGGIEDNGIESPNPQEPQSQDLGNRFGNENANGNGPFGSPDDAQQNQGEAPGSRQQFGRPNGNAQGPSSPQSAPYQYNRPQATNTRFGSPGNNNVAGAQGPQRQQFNRPQAARPSSQFGSPAGNGISGPQRQYNRPQSPATNTRFGADGNDLGSEPQSQQVNRPQGPAQQFGRPQGQRPGQQYGAPNGNAPRPSGVGPQGFNQQFNQPQASQFGSDGSNALDSDDSAYQYNRPQNAGVPGTNNAASPFNQGPRGSNRFSGPGNVGPARAPARPSNQRPQVNNRSQFNQPGTGTENAEESGYDYNRPQGAAFSSGNQGRPQQSNQGAPFSSGNQGRPQPSNQASPFSSGNQGRPQPSNQARPQFGGLQSQQYSGAQPSNQEAEQGSQQFSRPGASHPEPQGFRPYQGSNAAAGVGNRGSFGSQPNSRPRGPATQSAPYEYNRPSASQASQPGSQSFVPQGQTFEGPKQPPSFDPEEGYKY